MKKTSTLNSRWPKTTGHRAKVDTPGTSANTHTIGHPSPSRPLNLMREHLRRHQASKHLHLDNDAPVIGRVGDPARRPTAQRVVDEFDLVASPEIMQRLARHWCNHATLNLADHLNVESLDAAAWRYSREIIEMSTPYDLAIAARVSPAARPRIASARCNLSACACGRI